MASAKQPTHLVLYSDYEEMQLERDAYHAVIEKASAAWLSLHPGIPWEGDLGDAMRAAVREIDRLRAGRSPLERLESTYLEECYDQEIGANPGANGPLGAAYFALRDAREASKKNVDRLGEALRLLTPGGPLYYNTIAAIREQLEAELRERGGR